MGYESQEILLKALNFVVALASNFVDTEETPSGEQFMSFAYTVMETLPENLPGITSLLQNASNTLGIVWSERKDFDKMLHWLNIAEKLRASGRPAVDERLYTQTTYFLAQAHGKLNNRDESASWCLVTLKRQQTHAHEYSELEWSRNAMHLSEYYMTCGWITMAHHCLNHARVVLTRANGSDAEDAACMDIAFGKLFLRALEVSRLAYIGELDDLETSGAFKDIPPDMALPPIPDETNATASNANASSSSSSSASDIGALMAHNAQEAAAIFRRALARFQRALEYYVLDGFVTEHVSILNDISNCYRSLIGFEADLERKARMYKARLNLLEPLTKELNPSVFESMLQQLLLDCGTISSDLHDTRYSQWEQDKTVITVKKLNDIAYRGVLYFTRFINSFKNDKGEVPYPLKDADLHHPYITAHFHLARLHMRIQSSDVRLTVSLLKKSRDEYAFVVKYHQDASMGEIFGAEADLAKQIVELLALKITKLSQTMQL